MSSQPGSGLTLREHYRQLLNEGFAEDRAQAVALEQLDDLALRLAAARRQRAERGPLGRLLSRFTAPPKPVRGLYLWGGVGRGKTWLMDLFYEHLDTDRKLRLHFHRFMYRVHRELRASQGVREPLDLVAQRLAEEAEVLCFDEFFVSDIGDAMILGELLGKLFRRGVALVATSNIAPQGLYANGLQRSRFLPAIALLHDHTDVFHLDSSTDYRLRALEQAELYCWPLGEAAERTLQATFRSLAPEEPEIGRVLLVEDRPMQTRATADDVVWFDFPAICEGPRSVNDYIELARLCHAVVVSNVPRFTQQNEDSARRFIGLVDEFYDHGVKLILSAEASIADLYAGERLVFEFERTRSRLLEMQSHDYLAARHEASHLGPGLDRTMDRTPGGHYNR